MISFKVNNKAVNIDDDPDTPLLWVLRDNLHLTGTKYGCGIGQCGACTVHIDGKPRSSCRTKLSTVAGKSIVTIEGLATSDKALHPVQQAWLEEDVPQCGYCQGGQILTAAALLEKNPKPDDAAIDEAMSGNLCRCGTYVRIRKAIKLAAVYAADTGDAS